MSEELIKAVGDYKWAEDPKGTVWRIHYDPDNKGSIVQIAKEDQSQSDFPYIEINEQIAQEFIAGRRYQREYKVVDNTLQMQRFEYNIHEASDKRIDQLTKDTTIEVGTYFVTVKGDPDLVIDTVLITEENKDVESSKIKEYLENNDVYKDQ
tara:strand:- start:33 stop:488 length:456 start_codon:yes stop_codon:yes gene_type:complete